MAGVTLPNVILGVSDTILHTMGAVVPAAKFESVCLMAALGPGTTADNYVNVFIADTLGPNSGQIIYQEPIRYRQPGGNVVLLLNFILNAGQAVQVQLPTAAPAAVFCLFDRYQFDA